jgi:hypothetical protein
MSPLGPSRHFDAAQQLGRFRSEADIDLGGSRDRWRLPALARVLVLKLRQRRPHRALLVMPENLGERR